MGWGELDMVLSITMSADAAGVPAIPVSSCRISHTVPAVVSPTGRAGSMVSRRERRGEL